ncbi:MAG: hypothetical protein JXN61_04595 [Sedimentisphaerales bacterium]|nr:hypothetical protein [Sedimentisphaerales bacterium]
MPDENNNVDNNKDSPEVCIACSGTGTIAFAFSDAPQIDPDDVIELACPICLGSGKARRLSRPVRIRLRLPQKKIWPGRRKSGRRGRLSRSPIILPLPGSPLSGRLEGNMIPRSTPESEYIGPYSDKEDAADGDEDQPLQHPGQVANLVPDCPDGETVLRISDDLILTIGGEFGQDISLDTEFAHSNFQEPLELGSGPVMAEISYDLDSSEPIGALPNPAQPPLDLPIEPLAEDAVGGSGKGGILHPEETRIDLSGYDPRLSAEIANDPLGKLAIPPHHDISATNPSLRPPALDGPVSPLDVVGFLDPFGLNIDTDVIGPTGV